MDIAKTVERLANDAITAARAPLPRLRWFLAVELITSGQAFELFPRTLAEERENARASNGYDSCDEIVVDDATESEGGGLRRRLGPRFIRRALLKALLEAPVAAAEEAIEVARAAAQARDASWKPTRVIVDAPAPLQRALKEAKQRKKDAERALKTHAPGGCRPRGGAMHAALGDVALTDQGSHDATTTLRVAIDAHRQHANRLAAEVGTLLPYLRALAAAGGQGVSETSLDHATVQQSGFELLNDVMAGHSPQCCICCAPAKAPCITRCMHLACTRCMVTWYHAAPLHGTNVG